MIKSANSVKPTSYHMKPTLSFIVLIFLFENAKALCSASAPILRSLHRRHTVKMKREGHTTYPNWRQGYIFSAYRLVSRYWHKK